MNEALTEPRIDLRARHDVATVLLVDDRPENLLALEAVLEPLDQRLVRAGSGEEALAFLLREECAVILLDVQMPGLDGFATAELIRARDRTRNIPIVFLTAISSGIEFHLRGYATGAVDYISKPFDPDVLRAKVGVFIELHRKDTELRAQTAELARRLDELNATQNTLRRRSTELARSNADLERFAHFIAHDLNEPLSTTSGFLELLGEHIPHDGESRLLWERALASTQSMKSLIAELVRYSSFTSEPQPSDVSLGSCVETALADIGGAPAVTVGTLPRARVDATQISQVFAELISNALRFHSSAPARISIDAVPDGDWVTVTVADNGIGIDPKDAVRIFTIFQRLQATGPGVGLALCRAIVEQHGGRIWVESAPGQGARFHFTVPAASP